MRTSIQVLICIFLLSTLGLTAQNKTNTTPPKNTARLEGQRAYENKCISCHRETRKYPRGTQAAVIFHMRVRGDLTEKEARAVLYYLTK